MSAETSELILEFLQKATEPQSAAEIASALGFVSPQRINPSIYKLHRNAQVEKLQGTPIHWTIKVTEPTGLDIKEEAYDTDLVMDEKLTFDLVPDIDEPPSSSVENEDTTAQFVMDRKGDKNLADFGLTQEKVGPTEQCSSIDNITPHELRESDHNTGNISTEFFVGSVKQEREQQPYSTEQGQQHHLALEDVEFPMIRSPKSKTLHDEDDDPDDPDSSLSRSCKRVCLDPESGFQANADRLAESLVQMAPEDQPEIHSSGAIPNIPRSPAEMLASSSQFVKRKPQHIEVLKKSSLLSDTGQAVADVKTSWQPAPLSLDTWSHRSEFEETNESSDMPMDTDASGRAVDEVDQFGSNSSSGPEPKNALQQSIVLYLSGCSNRKEMATKIAKAVGFKAKKDINRELYSMEKNGLLKRAQESPPVWELCHAATQKSSLTSGINHPKTKSGTGYNKSETGYKNPVAGFQRPVPLMSLDLEGECQNPEPQAPVIDHILPTMGMGPPQPPVRLGRGRGILSLAAQNRVGAKNGPLDGQTTAAGTIGSSSVNSPSARSLPGGGIGRGMPPSPAQLLKSNSIFGARSGANGQFETAGKQEHLATAESMPTHSMFAASGGSQRQRQLGSYPANYEQAAPKVPPPGGSVTTPCVSSIFDSPVTTGDKESQSHQQQSLMSAITKDSNSKAAPVSQSRNQRAVNTPSFSLKQNIPPSPRSILGLGAQPSVSADRSTGPSIPSLRQDPMAPSMLQTTSLASISSDSFAALNKNAVSALMEYAQARKATATIKIVGQRGPPHNPKFQMAAIIGKRQFPVVESSNKKEGKKEAADIALRTLMAEGEYKANQQVTTTLTTLGKASTHFDRMAALAHCMFNKLAVHVAETMSGRKILAAIIMMRGEGDQGTVVSLGTGNRCITGNYMSLEGQTINDSHAEIVSRRGLIRFIYQQILEYAPGDPNSILEQGQGDRLKVKDTVSFHLYISTAPCGDGALFSPRDSHTAQGPSDDSCQAHLPLFSSKVQGVLRTKMEGGEGTIPIEANFKSQTWDGILRGERLRTMSCSDKICRWNIVGMQGALLSHFVEPIYLDSLTLGLLYDHGHLSRAVCCRLSHEEPDLSGALPLAYRVNHPRLGRVTVCDVPRETQKTKEYSVNWCVGDSKPEVVDGTKGICVNARTLDDQVSRLSKCSLYHLFKSTCQRWGRQDLLALQTYGEAKARAVDFQNVKQLMYEKFRTRGYGPWVSKPQEEEMFS